MQLEEHAGAAAFLSAAAPVLEADEARHNLMFGICSTLLDAPDAYPEAHLWTVVADDVVAAALVTPPFNLVVAQPLDDEALSFVAEALHQRGVDLPGVTGAIPEADLFAAAWAKLTGLRGSVRMKQGIYAARSVQTPSGVSGAARHAHPDDRDLLVDWLQAFQDEALAPESPHVDLERMVEHRLAATTAGLVLWEDESQPVSMCGFGGRTPHGIRIGPVYTPPDLRRRGYAGALTAHVTQQQLDGGRDHCFLYTDLANPTSNRIYMNVGYERVCDSAEYAFENRTARVRPQGV
jgi:GNAT superfamily N-acetyltransferase